MFSWKMLARLKFYFLDHFAFQKECLEAHNMLRKQHDCPPLQWSIELTELAQSWADQLVDKSRALYAEHAGK